MAAVIGGHVLMLIYFQDLDRHRTRTLDPDSGTRTEVFFIELPPEVKEPPPGPVPPPQAAIRRPRETVAPDTSITLPSESPPVAGVDWYREAGEVVKADREKKMQSGPRAFGQQPATPYVKCKRPKLAGFEPVEKKAGIEGGVPYVRLGKRCVLVLAFPVCQLGKLPKPKGVSLEEMRDPDQPESSVPDAEDCVP